MDPENIFLKTVWSNIPSDEDVSWVDRVACRSVSTAPMGDYGAIVQHMLDKGVSAEAIARFAKCVGYETAFGICYALGGPDGGLDDEDLADEIGWGLFRTDPETEEVIEPMDGGHENLLSMDPRGDEMAPPADLLAALDVSHHDTVVSANARLRRDWLRDHLSLPDDVEAFEFPPERLPFAMKPPWPGRRVGFLLGFTETDVWIMSNGLSDPTHPADDADWHRVVPLPSPEILSRVPAGSIERRANLAEHLVNAHVRTFLNVACAALRLHLDKASRGSAHRVACVESPPGERGDTVAGPVVHFGDLESLGMAEPIPLSDHDRLRVPVHAATVIDAADVAVAEADAAAYSRRLADDGLLGRLVER